MAEGKESNPVGRPSSYTPEIGAEICRRLTEGESLRQICRDDGFPDRKTVISWVLSVHNKDLDEFRLQYALAREAQAEHWSEEIIEISDDGTNDWMERETKSGDSITVADHEHISRSKLRVDTRKWLMSKMLPKKYGDRVVTEVTGANGGPIETKDVSELDVARSIAFLLAKAAKD